MRSLSLLEGIARKADPTFSLMEEAYPYILERMLMDNSPELRRALRYIIYGKGGVFDARRFVSMVESLEAVVEIQGLQDLPVFKSNPLEKYMTAPVSGPSEIPVPAPPPHAAPAPATTAHLPAPPAPAGLLPGGEPQLALLPGTGSTGSSAAPLLIGEGSGANETAAAHAPAHAVHADAPTHSPEHSPTTLAAAHQPGSSAAALQDSAPVSAAPAFAAAATGSTASASGVRGPYAGVVGAETIQEGRNVRAVMRLVVQNEFLRELLVEEVAKARTQHTPPRPRISADMPRTSSRHPALAAAHSAARRFIPLRCA